MGNSPITIGLKVGSTHTNDTKQGISFATAGSTLQGVVYLFAGNNSGGGKPIKGHSVRLTVVGIEESQIHYTEEEGRNGSTPGHRDGHTDTHVRNRYENKSRIFYRVEHTIRTFPDGIVSSGQYEFPFLLELPDALPSSLFARRGESSCTVKYEVVAELFQTPNSIFHKNPKATQPLEVTCLPPLTMKTADQDTSRKYPLEVIPIHGCDCCCCMCFPKGTMALEAIFDKTTLLLPPEMVGTATMTMFLPPVPSSSTSVVIRFRCQNNSTQNVQCVKADLVEVIEWSANGRRETVRTILATTTNDASLYPELTPSRSLHQRARRLEHLPWRTIDLSLTGQRRMPHDTYQGQWIQVRHILTIHLKCEGFCSTNHEASTLVQMYRRPLSMPVTKEENETYSSEATASTDPRPPGYFASATPVTVPFQDDEYPTATIVAEALPIASESLPTAEAHAVWADWDALTADVVTIPKRDSDFLGSHNYTDQKRWVAPSDQDHQFPDAKWKQWGGTE